MNTSPARPFLSLNPTGQLLGSPLHAVGSEMFARGGDVRLGGVGVYKAKFMVCCLTSQLSSYQKGTSQRPSLASQAQSPLGNRRPARPDCERRRPQPSPQEPSWQEGTQAARPDLGAGGPPWHCDSPQPQDLTTQTWAMLGHPAQSPRVSPCTDPPSGAHVRAPPRHTPRRGHCSRVPGGLTRAWLQNSCLTEDSFKEQHISGQIRTS